MVASPSFDDTWPHRVMIRDDADFGSAWSWLMIKNHHLNGGRDHNPLSDANVLYTFLTNRYVGFKDPQVAMEFKLSWG